MLIRALLVCFYFFIAIFYPLFAQQVDKSKYALLWEISGKDLPKPTYIFGSMHLPDARVFELSDSVMVLLDACEAFAAEVDLDSAMTMSDDILQKQDEFYLYGTEYGLDLKLYEKKAEITTEITTDIVPEPKSDKKPEPETKKRKKRKKAKKEVTEKKGLPNPFEQELPRTRQNDKTTFLDSYLAHKAKTHGKTIYGLEVLEQHMNMYGGSMGKNKKKDANSEFDSLQPMQLYDKMVEYYRSGDLEKVAKFSEVLEGDSIMNLRNYIMVNSILRITKKQTLFSVMGCAHLIGEEGVVNIFRKKGYQVRIVTPQFTQGDPDKYIFNSPQTPVNWYENKYVPEGYALETPFKPTQNSYFGLRMNILNPWEHKGEFVNVFDVFTGCFYAYNCHPQDSTSQATNLQELLKEIDGKLITQKPFEAGKAQGIEYLIYNKSDTLQGIRARILEAQGNQYTLIALTKISALYEPHIARFFDSFKLMPIDTTIKVWEDKAGAFATEFYNLPAQKSQKTTLEVESIHHRQYTHSYRTPHELVMYRDLMQGEPLQSDSIMFKGIELYIKEKIDTAYTKASTTFQGYPSQTFAVRAGKDSIRIKSYLRGNRHYIIAEIQPTAKAWETFRFLPFQPYSLEKKDFKKAGISLMMPAVKHYEKLDSYRPDLFAHTYKYQSTEPNTGVSFSVEALKYGKYTYFTHEDSLKQCIKTRYITEKDTTLPTQAAYTLFKNKHANTYKILQSYYKPEGVYTLQMELPKELFEPARIDVFLNSLTFLPDSNQVVLDIFKPKSALLLADLQSKDATVFQQAKEALPNYAFTESDKNALMRLLDKPFADDSTESYTPAVALVLWEHLQTILRKNTTPQDLDLLSAYCLQDTFQAPKYATIKVENVLKHFVKQKTQASLDFFLEVLKAKPDTETTKEMIVDSLALLEINYQKYLAYPDRKAFQSLALNASERFLWANDTITHPLILKNLPTLYKIMAQGRQGTDTTHINSLSETFMGIVSRLSTDERAGKVLTQIADSKLSTNEMRLRALELLVRDKYPILPATVADIAEDNAMLAPCLQIFHEENRLDLVPKSLQNQAKIAKRLALKHIENQYLGAHPNLEFLRKVRIMHEGKRTTFYVYKATFKEVYSSDPQVVYVGGFRKGAYDFYPKVEATGNANISEDNPNQKYDSKWLSEKMVVEERIY